MNNIMEDRVYKHGDIVRSTIDDKNTLGKIFYVTGNIKKDNKYELYDYKVNKTILVDGKHLILSRCDMGLYVNIFGCYRKWKFENETLV